ncbi:MAG: hypothetical protein M3N16_01900 [Actinomycetota bacterium]|nr:hypothetical protein [Actinomycetota bacterium]
MDEHRFESLRAYVSVLRSTADRIEGIIDDDSVSPEDAGKRLAQEQLALSKAIATIQRELWGSLGS